MDYELITADANVTSIFGPGIGGIYGTMVQCTGSEGSLTDCVFNRDASACTHSNDAGVRCSINCKLLVSRDR